MRKLGGTAKPPINGRVRNGSNTKTFTATLVLQLVAEGKIGLYDPVAGYPPESGLDRRITVRMLLQHTSGVFNGGKLLPAPLLAEMCKPHPKVGYGLGVSVQDTDRGDTVITHNGGIAGHAALMYSTPDGSKTLTASLNCVNDAAMSMAEAFQKATQRLVKEVFCGGQAGSADEAADPAQPTD